MDKENVTNMHNGILFGHKKEVNLALCDNMDESGGHSAKKNNSEKDKHCMLSLIGRTLKKFIDAENRLVVSKSKGGRWVKRVQVVQKYKLPVVSKSQDAMYGMVTIVNSPVLCM